VATKSLIYSCRVCRRISKYNLLGAAAVCFRSICDAKREPLISKEFLNGIMTYEICTEISGQGLNISIYDNIFSEKVYNMMIFKHGQIVPYMARPDRYGMTRQVVDLPEQFGY